VKSEVLAAVAVALIIAQSDVRDTTPCCIVDMATYSSFGSLMVKRNIG
jgi:hypothetical protein